jgi:site-specific recombinase XerD
MKIAKCALRCFYREHLKLGLAWTVFEDLRIAPPQTLPLVLTREQVATLLKAVQLPRYRTALGLIYHTGLRVGEAVRIELRDLRETHTEHPRLHVRCGKGGKDRFVPCACGGKPTGIRPSCFRGRRLAGASAGNRRTRRHGRTRT